MNIWDHSWDRSILFDYVWCVMVDVWWILSWTISLVRSFPKTLSTFLHCNVWCLMCAPWHLADELFIIVLVGFRVEERVKKVGWATIEWSYNILIRYTKFCFNLTWLDPKNYNPIVIVASLFSRQVSTPNTMVDHESHVSSVSESLS